MRALPGHGSQQGLAWLDRAGPRARRRRARGCPTMVCAHPCGVLLCACMRLVVWLGIP